MKESLFVNVLGGLITAVVLFIISFAYKKYYGESSIEVTMNFTQILILVIVIFASINIALWGLLALKNEPNAEKEVLKDIAIHKKDNEVALWGHGEYDGYSVVQTNETWQLWIWELVKATNRQDLDYYNFGEEFYFFDLSSCKKIEIPTGNDAKHRMVGETMRPGMVLRLMAA